MTASLRPSPLGRPTTYGGGYDPTLLHPVARAPQRAALGLGAAVPFSGADLWTAYELAWLNARGKPEVAVGMFRVPAESPNVVESKSAKLYLNAFSETRFTAAAEVEHLLRADLGRVCGAPVTVALVGAEARRPLPAAALDGDSIDHLEVEIDRYSPAPHLLAAAGAAVEETLVSDLFKSNCPVTGQPDWGSVQIRYRGPQIDRAGLLRYLVSFRGHAGFHEHCVEQMFLEILQRCGPERLSVYARFLRRGGIDINPFRSNWEAAPAANVRTGRQ